MARATKDMCFFCGTSPCSCTKPSKKKAAPRTQGSRPRGDKVPTSPCKDVEYPKPSSEPRPASLGAGASMKAALIKQAFTEAEESAIRCLLRARLIATDAAPGVARIADQERRLGERKEAWLRRRNS